MNPFTVEMPGSVRAGTGALAELRALAVGLGRRVLLVTGEASFDASAPLTAMGEELSRAAGRGAMRRLRCAPGEPTEESVDAAAGEAAAFAPDVIVAVGGGSVLDTAKALSVLSRFPGSCRRYLEGTGATETVPGPCVPWIAVPTTSGTGSEATKNAVVRSRAAGAKRSMRSPLLLARAVVLDPALTAGLPPGVTGSSGLDALTQLVEARVARGSSPFTAAIVDGAFPRMLAALEGLLTEPTNLALRADAAWGAFASGVALANAGLGAAHGFAAAVGALGVPHGLACALFLPPVLAANAPVIRDTVGRLVAGCAGRDAGDPVTWLADRVRRLTAAWGLPPTLAGFGIPRSLLDDLAAKSMGSSMRGNPRELSEEERRGILSAVTWGETA